MPARSPNRTPANLADLVEEIRRSTKFGAARIAAILEADHGHTLAPGTVHRILVRRGIRRVTDLDLPSGEQLRAVLRYEHDAPGSLIHVDINKLGRILTGSGWWAHGRESDQHRTSKHGGQRTGAVEPDRLDAVAERVAGHRPGR
ncbi:hypothetical protein ACU635_59070 [[Actinomadura] parvosata]|uniref:hypothetical protein n=1 Tax=[Actinomadura] parvosata TaxID=1955412 RepID=UPI00406CC223